MSDSLKKKWEKHVHDVLDHLACFPKACGSQIPFTVVLPQICYEGITSTMVQ